MNNKAEYKEAPLIGSLLFSIYGICPGSVRSLIRTVITKIEGGELYSRTLRRIFKKYHFVDIGMYSYGACFVVGALPPGTTIGRYSSITNTARAFNANHPLNIKSTHALFYNPAFKFVNELIIARPPLVIGNDVFIGHNVTILPSVRTIGDGSVIGAGAVVMRNVAPYAVVLGYPAVVVRYRFSEPVRKQLLESKWWESKLEDLRPQLSEFQVPIEGGAVK